MNLTPSVNLDWLNQQTRCQRRRVRESGRGAEWEADSVPESASSLCALNVFCFSSTERLSKCLYLLARFTSISLSPSLLLLTAPLSLWQHLLCGTICSALCVIETFATQFMPIFIGPLNNSHFLISPKQKIVPLSLSLCVCLLSFCFRFILHTF